MRHLTLTLIGTLTSEGRRPLGATCRRAHVDRLVYHCRMPVPAPSPDARALVTGASQNIGAALATELAARGHSLIVTARREDVLNALAARLTETYRVTVEVRPADLTDAADRAKLAEELAARPISILCANAGTATFGPVAALDPAAEKVQVQLNVLGVHDLVLAVLPGMVERGAGGILISGSAAGNSPIPYNATYAATKAFVNTFSESLRGELRGSGVHVTLLAPGPVRTEPPDPVDTSLVDKLVPDFLWISTEHTARVALDALTRNKMRVVPGLTSKAMSVASQYAPRAIVAPIVGSFYKRLGG
ncbi:short-chain type dehydrogenase/reductase [Mycobacterium botniense]|uniref:Short-chain type dehydrogenase/reductase n=2 Tax=Mycobacterium botniense TaxID=84962 RepID=A0A7I9XZQ9_9MYCO|nr:short-chain type dehydrogenase/reductase [Mycobacterium botniense]